MSVLGPITPAARLVEPPERRRTAAVRKEIVSTLSVDSARLIGLGQVGRRTNRTSVTSSPVVVFDNPWAIVIRSCTVINFK